MAGRDELERVPSERAKALRDAGMIDAREYEEIVSADARFRREEAAWQRQLEAHYSPDKEKGPARSHSSRSIHPIVDRPSP